ncbi:uncharacterized protein [Miscanthus floridulus]|uniref:uncharacterized protein n=1 Tax=Miscanthus floridulus TaxID=154761 RepID=UPI0034591CD5
MEHMDDNPLFGVDSNSDSSSADGDAPVITPPPAAVLQTVNIKSHVPVVLELAEPNYDEWRCFFDAFIDKFSLGSHLSSPPTHAQRRDPEWRVKDQSIISWLYNSIAKDVRDIVRKPRATAFAIWGAVQNQFRDNQLHRAG